MNFEDVRKSWQSEVTRPESSGELQRLLMDAQRHFGGLERKIYWRDIREILAGVFVAGGFAAGWPIYRSSFVACLGVAIILLSVPIVVYLLISANRPTSTSVTTSVLEFSRQRLAWIDRQIHLLRTVVWWYVAPLFLGCTLVAWGLTPGRRIQFGILMVLNVFVAIVVIWLNRRAVRKDLMPVRQEMGDLIESLQPTSES
jgi:hypothetical protein